MKAAVFKGLGKPVIVEDVPDPAPGPGEVVIKVGRCGICGSDTHMTSSPIFGLQPGTALGHEYSGEVVALGSGVDQLKIGDRVSAMPAAGCGACEACYAGHPYACAKLRMMMGGFGEYTLATANVAIKLPAAVSLADGALVEPLAAALRAVSMSRMARGAKVLVLGSGSMGLGTVFWARQLGAAKIVATARSSWREPLALAMGANAFVVSDDNLANNVNEALGGLPDIVFECAGVPGMIAQAVNLVRPRGMVVVEGCCIQPDQFVPFIAMYKEVCMQFTAAYTLNDFQHAVDTMERGHVEPRSMITQVLPLTAMPAALESLHLSNTQCKIMIDPWMA